MPSPQGGMVQCLKCGNQRRVDIDLVGSIIGVANPSLKCDGCSRSAGSGQLAPHILATVGDKAILPPRKVTSLPRVRDLELICLACGAVKQLQQRTDEAFALYVAHPCACFGPSEKTVHAVHVLTSDHRPSNPLRTADSDDSDGAVTGSRRQPPAEWQWRADRKRLGHSREQHARSF